jgi:cellobiose epimerase
LAALVAGSRIRNASTVNSFRRPRLALIGLLVFGLRAAHAAEPAAEHLRAQSERCRQLLKSSLVDFYLPAAVDSVHGGYLENLDPQGRFDPAGEKFLVMQGRDLWFFSTLALEGTERPRALAAAKSGFDFLQAHFRDTEHGGYFAKVSAAGAPTDPRKHAYLHSFALYGLVAYFRASGDPAALAAARELFGVMEKRMHDGRHGGYQEFFAPDWRLVTDPAEKGYIGAIGTKTYNTHLHLLESVAALYRVWPDPLVRQRLMELLAINVSTVKHPDFNHNVDGWQPDWKVVNTPRNLRASFGHDVECVWLVLDAARAVELPAATLRSWAEALAGAALQRGYDAKSGGLFYGGPLGQPADDTKKEWWVQAEMLVSMLELYRLTSNPVYLERFDGTLDFIARHHIAPEGGWYATRQADGSPLRSNRSTMWQGPYHGGRALILSAHLLDELARK